jgi:lambda repressor-like predicted transcriptional regulator
MTSALLPQTSFAKARGQDAKAILKAELKRRGMTYADLVARLEAHGVSETEANLRNKLSRGSFTAAFFLQCLLAIGCESIVLNISRSSNIRPD